MANALKGFIGRMGVWGMVFLAVGLVLMLLVVLLAGRWFQASRRVEAELARIREAGEPVTPDDLERYYQVPSGEEDTTALWLQAFRALETPEFVADARALPIVGESEAEVPLPGEPWPQVEAAEKLLDKYGRSLELLHEAAHRGGTMTGATDAAIACERYRRKHGKLPQSLEEVVPEFLPQVPTDPFDGEPLRYVVADDGYLVYSVGPDATDHGGQSDETGQPDLVFRIRRSSEANRPSDQRPTTTSPN